MKRKIIFAICLIGWQGQQLRGDKICAVASLAMPVIARDVGIWINALVADETAYSKTMAILKPEILSQVVNSIQASQAHDVMTSAAEKRQLSIDELKQLKSNLRAQAATSILQSVRSKHLENALRRLSPNEQMWAEQVRKILCTGDLEYANRRAYDSLSENVLQVFNHYMHALLSHFEYDSFAKDLGRDLPWGYVPSSRLNEAFDCIVMRDMVYRSLCRAWGVTDLWSQAIKKAVFELSDVTSKGQLRCMPELINKQIFEVLDNARYDDLETLISFFYFSNGVLRDFEGHKIIKELSMPAAILDAGHFKERELLNDLVKAHICSTEEAAQDVIMKAITNLKYTLSCSLPENMQEVFFDNMKLVCKSVACGIYKDVDKFVIDTECFKGLKTPKQFAAQSNVCWVKNILFEAWIASIADGDDEQALCIVHQLEGMHYAQALIKKDLSEHGLQLMYKIGLSDDAGFEEGVLDFTTVVQEQENNWVVRDMQGNVLVMSPQHRMDSLTAKSHKYMKEVLSEFNKPKEKPLDIEKAMDKAISKLMHEYKQDKEVSWRDIGTNAYKEFVNLPISSTSHLATACAALIVSRYCMKRLQADRKEKEIRRVVR